jgi:hypothetical protein
MLFFSSPSGRPKQLKSKSNLGNQQSIVPAKPGPPNDMPSSPVEPVSQIPITVFTGFLGAGKTSIILSLLPQLPSDYRVVLLKNEFGDIEGSYYVSVVS